MPWKTPKINEASLTGLRGGAAEADDEAITSFRLQRKNLLLFGKVTPLADDERPSSRLWWLAGGRTTGGRRIPTAGELRQRRTAEEENRQVVGFVGTPLGVRVVRPLPKVPDDKEGGKQTANGKEERK